MKKMVDYSIFSKLKFGVIIRSIEERTEKLCYESCLQVMPESNIHIIKNLYPSYKAHDKTFQIGIENRYDWYLALDADIIPLPDWLDIIAKKIEKLKNSNFFTFSHAVYDKFLGKVDRGNHCYNGKYGIQAREVIKHFARKQLKPEAAIKHYMQDISSCHFPEKLFGYHSFEQYYKDIYYQFWNRQRRRPPTELKNIFLNQCEKCRSFDNDYEVALMGWNSFRLKDRILSKYFPKQSLPLKDFHEKIKKNLMQSGITEKGACELSYESFLKKYSLPIQSCHDTTE